MHDVTHQCQTNCDGPDERTKQERECESAERYAYIAPEQIHNLYGPITEPVVTFTPDEPPKLRYRDLEPGDVFATIRSGPGAEKTNRAWIKVGKEFYISSDWALHRVNNDSVYYDTRVARIGRICLNLNNVTKGTL